MDDMYRTLALNPSSGDYLVTRCEHIRDVGWKALRVSLAIPESPTSSQLSAADRVSTPFQSRTIAIDRQ